MTIEKRQEIENVLQAWKRDDCLYYSASLSCCWQSPREDGILCACDSDHFTCLKKRLDELGVVIKVGGIREIERCAADPEAYVADGVGVSWERSAPIFGEFKKAGYVLTERLIDA